MKAIEWIKEHKWEILIAGSTIALGGLGLYAIYKKVPECTNCTSQAVDIEKIFDRPTKLNVIDLGVGAIDDALKYDDGTVELWLDNLKLDELGKLGEGISDTISDLPENANVWALLCIREDSP